MECLEQIYVCPGSDFLKTLQIRRDFLDDLFYGLVWTPWEAPTVTET